MFVSEKLELLLNNHHTDQYNSFLLRNQLLKVQQRVYVYYFRRHGAKLNYFWFITEGVVDEQIRHSHWNEQLIRRVWDYLAFYPNLSYRNPFCRVLMYKGSEKIARVMTIYVMSLTKISDFLVNCYYTLLKSHIRTNVWTFKLFIYEDESDKSTEIDNNFTHTKIIQQIQHIWPSFIVSIYLYGSEWR